MHNVQIRINPKMGYGVYLLDIAVGPKYTSIRISLDEVERLVKIGVPRVMGERDTDCIITLP